MTIPELRIKFEKEYYDLVIGTLNAHNGNKQQAANALKINRTTLVEYLRRQAPELLKPAVWKRDRVV